MANWYSVETAEDQERISAAWSDAPVENEELCGMILETARDQIIAYAPVLPDGEPVPARWVYAQLQQATNLWNAGRVSSGGEGGIEQFTFTPRPLDKTIRGIIRPTDGKLHVL
ncbi:hypothetical protein SRABI98_03546 [Microbacterium sp. Bi98]|uniref:hypothetical protein n=1 Tax=Microbacterium sp. Bi98 TaxID=2821116 RepID=UPI001E0A1879|nr:hypothetical protein [Microbacterium sp. Bi98]CAH0262583.1 hypothetical protein SRABI98_03546 [Microbacterium sp. Bi98]